MQEKKTTTRKRVAKINDLQKPVKKARSAGYKVTDSQLIEALRASSGLVTFAAKRITDAGTKISPQAISERILRNPELKKIVDEISNAVLDMAEAALFKKIQGGDLGAICFLLKCKGKSRGYIERQEIEHSGPGGGPIKIDNIKALTDDQLRELAANGKKSP